jgi:hypothetical protein
MPDKNVPSAPGNQPGNGAGQDDGPISKAAILAARVDESVPKTADAGDRVLVDNSRIVRWAGPLFVVCALILVPWIVITSITLPSRAISENWDVAWAGYDVGLFGGLLATAICALRRSRYLAVAASATGAMLLADAWFDVLTAASGWDLAQAVAMSVLAELPLASVCFWLALHGQDVAARRIVLLSGRPAGRIDTRGSAHT